MNEHVQEQPADNVHRPSHYTQFGVECVEFSRWMHSAQAQAFQYIWRCGSKHDDPTEDLRKAIWWLDDWIKHNVHLAIGGGTQEVSHASGDALDRVASHFDFCLGGALIAIYNCSPERARELVARHLELRAARAEAVPAGGAAGRQRRKS